MVNFTRLSPAIGARAHGMDLRRPMSQEQAEDLRRGLNEFQLLVFSDQQALTDEQHIKLAQVFGTVADEHLDGERISWVSNRRGGKGAAPGENKLFWHSDYTFTPWPLKAISLYAVEISGPAAPTRFASARRAWQALSPGRQAELAGQHALHMANFSGESADYGRQWDPRVAAPDPELYPNARHPICLTHPWTGDPLLFVNEYLTVRIEGVQPAESSAQLDSLFAVLYDPDFIYHHDWTAGDLVIWDNHALQHGRRAFAPAPGQSSPIRTLRRVVVSDHYNDILNAVPRLKAAMTQHITVQGFTG